MPSRSSSRMAGQPDKQRGRARPARHRAGKDTELVHRQGPWRNMQDLEMATLGWVDWFNNRRLLGPIGNIPPAEAEETFCAQRDVLDMAA